jgi:hypothetical protein
MVDMVVGCLRARGPGVRASGLDWQGVGFAVLSAGAGSGLIRWPASGHDMVSSRSRGGVDITYLLVHPATRWRVSLMVRVVASIEGGRTAKVPGMG